MDVERALVESAAIVARLHRLAHVEAFGETVESEVTFADKWTSLLNHADRLALVATDDGEPIGFVAATNVDGVGQIEDLYVVEEHRRRGVARGLLDALFSHWSDVSRWILAVEKRNSAARSLYESLGFRPTGAARIEERMSPPGVMLELESSNVTA